MKDDIMAKEAQFLCQAIELAQVNSEKGGRPFGTLVVKDGEVIATGVNEILATNDPTSHAELNAVRQASQQLGSPASRVAPSIQRSSLPDVYGGDADGRGG